ncbi:signal peptidase complex subunit 2 [Enteropsectra breve]|nr:signal peptidase complex subunit 2 [Enteropsectra breve]
MLKHLLFFAQNKLPMEKLLEKYNKKKVIIDVHNPVNLKATLDGCVDEYFIHAGCKRNYMFEDMSLAVRFVSVALAAWTTYMSVHGDFYKEKNKLMLCVVTYFVLNGVNALIRLWQGENLAYRGFKLETRLVDGAWDYEINAYKNEQKKPTKFRRSVFDLFYESGTMDHVLFLSEMDKTFKKFL